MGGEQDLSSVPNWVGSQEEDTVKSYKVSV